MNKKYYCHLCNKESTFREFSIALKSSIDDMQEIRDYWKAG